MHIRIQVYLVLLALCIPGLVWAQDAIDLEKAIQLALEHNTQIKRAAISLSVEKEKSDSVWNSFYPDITAQGNTAKQYQPEADSTVSGTIGASLTLSPAIVDSFNATRISYETGKISFADAKRDIERSVRKSWYALISEQEQLKVLALSEKNSKSSYHLTQEKYRAGLSSEIDLLNAQIGAEESELERKSAQVAFDHNKAVFSHLIGITDSSTVFFVLEEFDVPENIAGFNPAMLQNDSIRTLEKNIELAIANRQTLFKSSFLPYLTLGWNWETSSTIDNLHEWNERASLSASVTLQLDPLLPGSSARVQITEADATIADRELQLNDMRVTVQLDMEKLLSSIKTGQDNLHGYKATLTLAERSLELTREAYSRGTRDLTALETAEQNFREARLQVLKQKKVILEAITDLEYLAGLPFGTLGGLQ